jgi:type I restriction-modification system DNA methylase subunit
MSISTKEALKAHIHKIHDFIRNSGAGYGLDALKIFNFFYSLKILEPQWDELKLKNKKFSELVNIIETNKNIEEVETILTESLFNKEKPGILYELFRNPKLQKIVVSKIPDNLNARFYIKIILEINKIPTVNKNYNSEEIINDKFDVDIKGKTYEYFVGRDKSTISELGAYFSDRHITNFCYKIPGLKLNVEKSKKSIIIPNTIDPFGGSGGFTLTFIDYVNKNYPEVNWEENIKSIYHQDMMETVVKSAGLEAFALTGSLPNMDKNFVITNSFTSDFRGLKFKNILTNPPYGGDKNNSGETENKKLLEELKSRFYKEVEEESESESDNDSDNESTKSKSKSKSKKTKSNKKVKKFKWIEEWAEDQYDEIRQKIREDEKEIEDRQVNYNTCSKRIKEFCDEYDKRIEDEYKKDEEYKKIYKDFFLKTTSNDKEACSLILLMDLLDKNGVCIAILKEGVFFDNKYSALRKCLIDNFNVTNIISIPPDQFENTTTKTSIIVFYNNGQTKKVRFSELKVNKYSNDVYEEIEFDKEVTDKKGKKSIVKSKRLDLISHKDQIIDVEDIYKASATYEELSKPTIKQLVKEKKSYYNYSLNYKDYIKDDTFCPEGYKLVKMKDLIDYETKSKRPASFASEDGDYRFYTSSDTIKKCDECDFKSKDLFLIFGTGGKGSLFIDNKFSCSADNFVCKAKNDISNEHIKYIYQYLKNDWKKFLFKMFNGSTLGHINKARLDEFQIPIPKDITKLKPQITKLSNLHDKISQKSELIPQKEKEICELIQKLTDDGEEGVDWDEYELGKLLTIGNATRNISIPKNDYDSNNKDIIEFIRGSDVSNNLKNTKYCIKKDIYNRYYKDTECVLKEGDIILSSCSKSFNYMIVPKHWNDCPYHGCIRITNFNNLSNKYIYYLLNCDNIKSHLLNNQRGSTVGFTNISDYINLKIRLIKPKVLSKHKLDKMFDEVDKLKDELEADKKAYEDEIKKFMEPFKNPDENDDDENEEEIESESEPEEKPLKSKPESKGTENKKVAIEDEVKPKSKPTKKVESDNEDDEDDEDHMARLERELEEESKSVQTKTKTKSKSKTTKAESDDEEENEVLRREKEIMDIPILPSKKNSESSKKIKVPVESSDEESKSNKQVKKSTKKK